MKLELRRGRAHSHVEDNVVHRVKSRQLLFGASCPCNKVPLAQVGLWECLGLRTFLSCPTKVRLGNLGVAGSSASRSPNTVGETEVAVGGKLEKAVGHGAQ